MPQLWIDALALPGADAVRWCSTSGIACCKGRLPKVTRRFREAGGGLYLGRQEGQTVLVYALAGHFGNEHYCCWIGTEPRRD